MRLCVFAREFKGKKEGTRNPTGRVPRAKTQRRKGKKILILLVWHPRNSSPEKTLRLCVFAREFKGKKEGTRNPTGRVPRAKTQRKEDLISVSLAPPAILRLKKLCAFARQPIRANCLQRARFRHASAEPRSSGANRASCPPNGGKFGVACDERERCFRRI